MREEYRLTVVFCAVDESFSLVDTFTKIESYKCAYEYLFVLSKKATAECSDTVKNICKNENCRFIIQNGAGLGNAIRNAIDTANGTHMIVWPADDGMDTSSFPVMVELSKNNPEKIVSVSRWLAENGFEDYGKFKKVINFISQKAFAFLYKAKLTDFTNPTQIAPVYTYRQIKWEHDGFDFVPELTFKPLKIGSEFIEVPCRSFSRREGSSNCNYLKQAKYYLVILKIYFTDIADIQKVEER